MFILVQNSKIKTIVFDWDGTVVDSLKIKREAYFDLFPRHTKAYFAVQNLLPNFIGKATRSQILRRIFVESNPDDFSEEAFVAKYSKIYREIVENGILQNGFLPGVKEGLDNLHGKIPLYVNSATPIEPLLSIVEKIGANKYFKGVYGRSLAQENHTQHDLKVENLRDIAKKENLKPKEIIMVGDAEADRKSADIFGCRFLKIEGDLNLKDIEKVI